MVSTSTQADFKVNIVEVGENNELSWTTTLNHNYQVEVSPDLENWVDTGIAEPGTGSVITYGLMSEEEKLFYRIKQTEDPYFGGFLALPTQNQEMDMIDGVRFAFNLDVLAELPAKIRIYQREYQSGDQWELIGSINEFAERKGVTFVRGSVVWIPPTVGEYEVQAVAVDDTGATMGSAVRHVTVGVNQPPTITITGLTGNPTLPSPTALPMSFEVDVNDPDDYITRVEYYDNGIFIGSDLLLPLGNEIKNIEGVEFNLLKGLHSITAKVFDSRGGVGVTAQPFLVQITGGNSQPVLNITSSTSISIIQGQSLIISYTTSDADGASDIYEIQAVNIQNGDVTADFSAPFQDLTFNSSSWTPGSYTIAIRAIDMQDASSYQRIVNVYVKQTVGQSFAEKLLDNLLNTPSVSASNISFRGSEVSSGEFVSGISSGLQIDEGVLLTTGFFISWNSGNETEYLSTELNLPGDDLLRDRLMGGNAHFATLDAAVLEFDLFCKDEQLEFEFQFGSEEYVEYVNLFNDGFFITVNDVIVSLVPDGNDIASVNSIHNFIAAADNFNAVDIPAKRDYLYLSNDDDIRPNVDSSMLSQLVEYDGMTIKLRAHVLLQAETTHHVRIVIVDAKDAKLDSGFFIEKNSLKTITPQP